MTRGRARGRKGALFLRTVLGAPVVVSESALTPSMAGDLFASADRAQPGRRAPAGRHDGPAGDGISTGGGDSAEGGRQ